MLAKHLLRFTDDKLIGDINTPALFKSDFQKDLSFEISDVLMTAYLDMVYQNLYFGSKTGIKDSNILKNLVIQNQDTFLKQNKF